MTDLVAEIVDNLRRIFQVAHECSRRAEEETGLTGPQLWAVKVIGEFSPIRVSEVARRMHLHPTTVVGIIDRLEAKGLAVRIRSKTDRRVVDVRLTRQGKSLVAKAPEVAQLLMVKGLEAQTDEQLHVIANGVGQLVKMVGAQDLPPKMILAPDINLPYGGEGVVSRKI